MITKPPSPNNEEKLKKRNCTLPDNSKKSCFKKVQATTILNKEVFLIIDPDRWQKENVVSFFCLLMTTK